MANYQQPDYRVPAAPGVSVQVETIRNVLQTTAPVPAAAYVQPGVAAPAAPVANQLTGRGGVGISGAVRADGSKIF
jgi:hypothetical protein